MSDPHQVSRDILNHTSQPAKSFDPPQPYKTAQDILRSTKEEQPQQPESPIDPQDWYELSERNREANRQSTSSKVGDRVRGWVNEGKARVHSFNERHPTASKYAGYTAKGIGF
jgi:hypothetical protein